MPKIKMFAGVLGVWLLLVWLFGCSVVAVACRQNLAMANFLKILKKR